LLFALACQSQAEVLFDGVPDKATFDIKFAEASDNGLLADTTNYEGTWGVYLASSPARFPLAPLKRYRVSYDYNIVKKKSDRSRFYQGFDLPGDTNGNRMIQTWDASAGDSGKKVFTTTLPDSDRYRIVLGTREGGAIRITNIKIEEVPEPKLAKGMVYQNPIENDGRLVLNMNGHFVDDAFVVDTRMEKREWHRIITTAPDLLPLKKGHSYRVSYNFAVRDADPEASMQHFVYFKDETSTDETSTDENSAIAKQSRESWPVYPGTGGQKELFFEAPEAGTHFVIGTRLGADVRIENLEIEDVTAK